ncbi:poly-gamma-glutamate biosynthesis protein PgsC/CapC [Chondromyces crocatus]|uniref:Uncharacterized protein n=1 Tax=Chondromyces crocatus TaxID=52 RepID=A0A0K1E7L7_CHOCO|nr:poly-gamma-glutamate biosynthesis protein PgsC/CapC [Chondromyces crocatus]AKT36860.1 uncharacterized protein CMC5_009810 [Chondromyces crocatus]
MTFPLHIFPPNGLDRSLHTAVLIGLLIGTFFTETLGWTYAGLVVPGYLATVFYAAPITAAFIVFESILTYLFVGLLGRWVSKTGVWSTAFGRERFYLFIVGAVFVRLAIEGSAVPRLAESRGFVHSRELYSLGLVLVPLVANAFWNSGLKKAGPRLAVVTAVTAAILGVILRTTNLSVSRFQVLNESLSLAFLESPKAHLLLVIGALLGARANVLYGWDYNGILVPALLAVAWYEPTKLLTTTIEALVIYLITRFLIARPPFSRMLLVGPRRMMFVYIAGYLLKLLIGFAAARWAPGLQMIDYFGFGYLLPSLLAVKMWNKEHIGVVIMPTIQVSLTAFLVGNAVGYILVALGAGGMISPMAAGLGSAPGAGVLPQGGPPPQGPARATGSAAFSLMLADTIPRPGPIPSPDATLADIEARKIAHRAARELLDRGALTENTRRHAETAGIVALQEEGTRGHRWTVLGGRLRDTEHAPSLPRAAFRARPPGVAWLLLAAPSEPGSPLPAVALQVAEALDATGVVMLSRHPGIRRHDEAFIEDMASHLGDVRLLRLETRATEQSATLDVVGSAVGLPVAAIGQALSTSMDLRFRKPSKLGRLEDAPRLRISRPLAERVGATRLGAAPALRWPGPLAEELSARMYALTSVEPGAFRTPPLEELRLFDAIVAPRLLDGGDSEPSPWERAILGRLGFRAVSIGSADDGAPEAWGILDPPPDEPAAAGEVLPPRRGNPTWIMLRRPEGSAATSPPENTPAMLDGAPATSASSAPPAGTAPLATASALPSTEPSASSAPPLAPSASSDTRTPLLVQIPAPRWQIGAFGAGLAIARAEGARSLMIAGALPTADPSGAADVRRREGLRSWYQRWHELWLGRGNNTLSIQAIEADRSNDRDVVVSFGRELFRPDLLPPYARPLLQTFRDDLALRTTIFDGTREQVPYSAAIDASMAYAKRFAEGRFAIVYLGSGMREFFELRRAYDGSTPPPPGQTDTTRTEPEDRLLQRLARLGLRATTGDVADRGVWLATCTNLPAPSDPGNTDGASDLANPTPACTSRRAPDDCDLDASIAGFRWYAAQRNPYDLKAQATRGHAHCPVELVHDRGSGHTWAITARPGEALLMPLDGVGTTEEPRRIPTLERLRRAIAIGTSPIRIGTEILLPQIPLPATTSTPTTSTPTTSTPTTPAPAIAPGAAP